MTGSSQAEPELPEVAPHIPESVGSVEEAIDALPLQRRRGQLREFLETLGGFAPRTPKPEPPPGDEPAPARGSRSWVLIATFVVTLGVFLYTSWSNRPLPEMPSALLGAWATSTPSYADRGFWIGKRQVAFRVGSKPGDVNIYSVTRIGTRTVRGDTATYDIEYAVDGGTNQWSFRYSGAPRPAIIFVHQPELTWTPTPDPSPPIR
jgi:hypothetical protein